MVEMVITQEGTLKVSRQQKRETRSDSRRTESAEGKKSSAVLSARWMLEVEAWRLSWTPHSSLARNFRKLGCARTSPAAGT